MTLIILFTFPTTTHPAIYPPLFSSFVLILFVQLSFSAYPSFSYISTLISFIDITRQKIIPFRAFFAFFDLIFSVFSFSLCPIPSSSALSFHFFFVSLVFPPFFPSLSLPIKSYMSLVFFARSRPWPIIVLFPEREVVFHFTDFICFSLLFLRSNFVLYCFSSFPLLLAKYRR